MECILDIESIKINNMRISVNNLMVAQGCANRVEQISSLISNILQGKPVAAILVSEMENGQFRVEDGTHRAIAYCLSGREFIDDGNDEFQIVPFNKDRNTMGSLKNLIVKVLEKKA